MNRRQDNMLSSLIFYFNSFSRKACDGYLSPAIRYIVIQGQQ